MRPRKLISVAALGLLALAGPPGGHARGQLRATTERLRVAPGVAPSGNYGLRMGAGFLYAAYWQKAKHGLATLRLDAWRLAGARTKQSIVLLRGRAPSGGLYGWVQLFGPRAGRLLVDASPMGKRVWVIGVEPLRVLGVVRSGAPVGHRWTLAGLAGGGQAARFYRCANAEPAWKGKGVPPPSWDPPYRCGPLVVRDVPLSGLGAPVREYRVSLHPEPFMYIPVFLRVGDGATLWSRSSAGSKATIDQYGLRSGAKLRSLSDPGRGTSLMAPVPGGALVYAAVKSVPSRKDWGTRLLLYPRAGRRPLMGPFIRGCNFEELRIGADGKFAYGICSGMKRHVFLAFDFYTVSKDVAAFFQIADMRIINVVRLNKRYDLEDAAVERQGDWLVEAIADNPGHIRILRVPLPREGGAKAAAGGPGIVEPAAAAPASRCFTAVGG